MPAFPIRKRFVRTSLPSAARTDKVERTTHQQQRRCAPSPTQLGFTRVGHPKLSKSDISDFEWERVGVRGYGLSMVRDPSPGATRRPLPMGEVKRKINS